MAVVAWYDGGHPWDPRPRYVAVKHAEAVTEARCSAGDGRACTHYQVTHRDLNLDEATHLADGLNTGGTFDPRDRPTKRRRVA